MSGLCFAVAAVDCFCLFVLVLFLQQVVARSSQHCRFQSSKHAKSRDRACDMTVVG